MKTIVLTFSAVLISGCLKVEVKPQELVTDTIDASKGAYNSFVKKREGYKKRTFSHTLHISENDDESEAARRCIYHLRTVAEESSSLDVEIISEATATTLLEQGKTISCTVDAFI